MASAVSRAPAMVVTVILYNFDIVSSGVFSETFVLKLIGDYDKLIFR